MPDEVLNGMRFVLCLWSLIEKHIGNGKNE